MKIVYRAGDITEAEIVRGMLLSNDIEAHVSGYYLQGGIGETSPMDLAKVHVADEDFENARVILQGYEGSRIPATEPQQPAAGTNSTPASSILITILVIVAIAIFSFWIGI